MPDLIDLAQFCGGVTLIVMVLVSALVLRDVIRHRNEMRQLLVMTERLTSALRAGSSKNTSDDRPWSNAP